MSIVPLSFLNPHWLSGRSPDCSRCSFSLLSRILIRTFPAIDNKEMPRWLSHNLGFPFRFNRRIIDASLNAGIASDPGALPDDRSFIAFTDSETVGNSSSSRLHSTCGSLLIASSLTDDGRLRTLLKCPAHLFKIASLTVRRLVPSALRRGGFLSSGDHKLSLAHQRTSSYTFY